MVFVLNFILICVAIAVRAQNTRESCSSTNHDCLLQKISEVNANILDIPARLSALDRQPQNTAFCQIVHGSSCFVLVPKKMKWQHAFENCALLGGRLAEVHSTLLQTKIKELAAGLDYPSIYLGGTDAAEEGRWIWATSGQEIDNGFMDWNPSQPADFNSLDQDCMDINDANDGYGWNDTPCQTGETISLCEFDLN